jgi:hypothetical protein
MPISIPVPRAVLEKFKLSQGFTIEICVKNMEKHVKKYITACRRQSAIVISNKDDDSGYKRSYFIKDN